LYWLEDLDAVTSERYRAGTASQVEMLRAQNERAKRATQLAVDKNARDSRRLGLSRLLNRPLESAWPTLRLPAIADPVPFTPQLAQVALRYEARLKVLRQETQTAAAMLEATRRKRYPDVSVGVENRQYSSSGDTRQTMGTVSLSLPWVNRSKYRADREREEARLRAAELEVQDYEVFVPNEVRRLTLAIDAARREALFYRDEFVPRAETAVTSARAQWTTGRGMFYDLIEARRMWIEGRVMEAKAVAEQYRMLSELVLCCGLADLEALKMIGVEIAPEQPPKP
jgi:outer membrane protein TolC